MLKLKRFKIEKKYTVKLFYISHKFKRGILLPSIGVDTLKLKKRKVLKKKEIISLEQETENIWSLQSNGD